MKRLFNLNAELIGSDNYIFQCTKETFSFASYYVDMGYPIAGFCVFEDVSESEFLGFTVISLKEFSKKPDANIIICSKKWQGDYDLLFKEINPERIFVNSAPWEIVFEECVVCENELLFAGNAIFADFIRERMFQNESRPTLMMHCPNCEMYYSYYRPTDEELGRHYSGYRNEQYQLQRQRTEPSYSAEKNRNLYAPEDGGKERRDDIWNFIKDCINLNNCKNVLDFGGDKGQFIPDMLNKMDRYVYEISAPEVIDGVNLLTDIEDVFGIKWDIILCNMVMEHLSDIRGYFEELVSCMSENTILYIEVPYERYMEDADLSMIHEHINFFSELSFRYLAQRNKLDVIRSQTILNGKDMIQCVFRLSREDSVIR